MAGATKLCAFLCSVFAKWFIAATLNKPVCRQALLQRGFASVALLMAARMDSILLEVISVEINHSHRASFIHDLCTTSGKTPLLSARDMLGSLSSSFTCIVYIHLHYVLLHMRSPSSEPNLILFLPLCPCMYHSLVVLTRSRIPLRALVCSSAAQRCLKYARRADLIAGSIGCTPLPVNGS